MNKDQSIPFLERLHYLRSLKPEKFNDLDSSILGVVEQPAIEIPKREMPEQERIGWAAVAPAEQKRPKVWPEAQPAVAVIQEQNSPTAPVIAAESVNEIRQRLMAKTLPALLATLSTCDDPEKLLQVEAHLASLIIANNQLAKPAVAQDAQAYCHAPAPNSNNLSQTAITDKRIRVSVTTVPIQPESTQQA